MALPAGAQAKDKFGSDLKNHDGSSPSRRRSATASRTPTRWTRPSPATASRSSTWTWARPGNIKAPKDGKIDKIRLVALKKGSFKLELGKAKGIHGSDGKGRILHRGPKITHKSSVKGNDYKIQTFHVNVEVDKGDYLGIKSKKTSLLKCQSGSTEQLLFQPVLAIHAPFESNLGHRSNCTLLLQAVYK